MIETSSGVFVQRALFCVAMLCKYGILYFDGIPVILAVFWIGAGVHVAQFYKNVSESIFKESVYVCLRWFIAAVTLWTDESSSTFLWLYLGFKIDLALNRKFFNFIFKNIKLFNIVYCRYTFVTFREEKTHRISRNSKSPFSHKFLDQLICTNNLNYLLYKFSNKLLAQHWQLFGIVLQSR